MICEREKGMRDTLMEILTKGSFGSGNHGLSFIVLLYYAYSIMTVWLTQVFFVVCAVNCVHWAE